MQETTVWPLCSIFGNGGHVFDGSKIPTSVLCKIHQGTFTPSLTPIDHIMSKKKILEITLKLAKIVEKGQ